MFLSIFAATCRPTNIVPFFDNLANTCDDPSSFEILLKLDEGADELVSIIEAYRKTSPLNIKYLVSAKLEGYYTLDVGYNEMLKMIHPDSYFCWLLTDEIRFESKGWDSTLKKYIKFHPDDVFRIKLSIFQLKNYYDFFESLPCPDNYAVTTRKWLELTGGWGNFWGPDSWHQCVDYYLGKCKNPDNPFGVWRSFPIYDIHVGGQEAGQGISTAATLERERRIWQGWMKHSTHAAQENFKRLAILLNMHINATALGLHEYVIKENKLNKVVSLHDVEGGSSYIKESYKIRKISCHFYIGEKKIHLGHILPSAYIYRNKIRFQLMVAKQLWLSLLRTVYRTLSRTFKDIVAFTCLPYETARKTYHATIGILNKFPSLEPLKPIKHRLGKFLRPVFQKISSIVCMPLTYVGKLILIRKNKYDKSRYIQTYYYNGIELKQI